MRIFAILLTLISSCLVAAADFSPSARWITASQGDADAPNTWIAFRKDVTIDRVPEEVVASISADSKYWLWINGRQVVFEGQLKRGPSPEDTYFDRVDLRPYLRKGRNEVALLLWYFGKSGFSHKSSEQSGLLFSAPQVGLVSDASWMSRIHPAYGTCGDPQPNFRLSESSLRYDGRLDLGTWQTGEVQQGFAPSRERGKAGDAPWNKLVERPIPLWKDFGVVSAKTECHPGDGADTLVVHLPYNIQLTPVITVNDPEGGHTIGIHTDHIRVSTDGEWSVRAEYITRPGKQTYESLGWMNGDWLYVTVPHGVTVSRVAYRQTGYDTEVVGGFHCDDPFFNRYWEKGMRTLYVNMRDTYFDCPERERAQWWGDGTLLMAESFYSLDTRSHGIMRKGLLELCSHQKADHTIHSPIPGIYEAELPGQMLATIGLKGMWRYYMNTGDKDLIARVYPHVCRYLSIWKLEPGGLTAERHGAWDWGDWGDNRDIRLIYAAWHYIALDGAARMADLLQHGAEARNFRQQMERLKVGFNACWNGQAYRHPSYQGATDDRVQALAVVAGLADASKYAAIKRVFEQEKWASPYMEKYVTDACFIMGVPAFGLDRCEERYGQMVNSPLYTTLFEGWGVGKDGFGGGTNNHAWSGGPLVTLCEYVMGVTPVVAGWKRFAVDPTLVRFGQASLDVPTVSGKVHFSFKQETDAVRYRLTVPEGTEALVYLPVRDLLRVKGNLPMDRRVSAASLQRPDRVPLLVPAGKYSYTVAK